MVGRAASHAENQSAYDEAARLWGKAAERADHQQARIARSSRSATRTASRASSSKRDRFCSGCAATSLQTSRRPASTQMYVRAELARIAIFRDGDSRSPGELLTEGLEMASGEETVRAELMLRHQLGNLAIWVGEYEEAIRIHEENVERAGEGAEFYRRGWGLNSLAFALTQSGEFDRQCRRRPSDPGRRRAGRSSSPHGRDRPEGRRRPLPRAVDGVARLVRRGAGAQPAQRRPREVQHGRQLPRRSRARRRDAPARAVTVRGGARDRASGGSGHRAAPALGGLAAAAAAEAIASLPRKDSRW